MASKSKSAIRRRRGSSPTTTTTTTTTNAASSHTSSSLVNTVKSVEKKIESTLLQTWDDIDEWRRDNAFIISGYRPTSNSYQGSLSSIFSLHNESVNIWTHLAGSILFTSFGAAAFYFYEKLIAPRYASATWTDVLVFGCFFTGAFLCLGMSATFHTLCNHSPEVAKWGNKLDYTGIVCLIIGSYMPALYYGFHCLPELMEIYLSTIWILGLGCLAVSWFERFRTPAWRPYRALMFVCLGVSGVVPIVHGITMYGYQELNERMGLNWVILQGFFYILGAFIYAIRWPERFSPKTFDIWGSSHQIFHVLILMAAGTHLYGMIKAFDFHHGVLGARC